MARTRPTRPITAELREERVSGYAALPTGKSRVDREKGVIYGVKVVGRSSPNTHGVRGVDGTEYTMEALTKALPLYEGVNCNVDHPSRKDPNQERSAKDRFAWVEHCAVQESGIYGDLHFLDPADPLAVKMMAAAENKPDAYALSHNAVGRGEVKGGKYVIHEIPEVRSVDIVADGGTNRSLFEGRKPMKKKTTLTKIIAESKYLSERTRKRLLEMAKGCPEADEEMDAGEERADMEGEEEPGWKDHVTNAVGALVKSEDPEDHDKASKLMKHLRPAEESEEDDEERDTEEAGDTPKDGDSDDDEGESQAGRKQGPEKKGFKNDDKDDKGKESMESRQKKARKRCELAGVNPTKDLVESLAKVNPATWDSILLSVRGAGKGAPRSSSPGGTRIVEGAETATKAKQWSRRLLA
jgi:hypothetical protein